MKTLDFGIVLRVTLNYMQRVRVPVYTPSPTIPGICDLVHVLMGLEKKILSISRHKLPSDEGSPSIPVV